MFRKNRKTAQDKLLNYIRKASPDNQDNLLDVDVLVADSQENNNDNYYSQYEEDYIQRDLEEYRISEQRRAEESWKYLEERRKKKRGRSIATIIASVVVAGSAVGGVTEYTQNIAMTESYNQAVSYVIAEDYDAALEELTDVTIDDADAIASYAYVQSNIDDYKGKPESMLEAIQEVDSIENKDVKRQQALACDDLELAEEIQEDIDGLDLSSVDSISKGEVSEIETLTNKLDSRYRVLLVSDKYDLASRVLSNVESKNEAGQLIAGIDGLGDITLDSKDEIDDLKKAYNNLSNSDKETILNYSILTAAEGTYAKLKKAEDERIAAEKKAEEERIAAEKKAEEERRAAEEEAEQERLAAAAKEAEQSGEMVWIPRTGSKYHRTSTCSNMKNPSQVSRSQAESWGYDPCKKCY